MDNLKRLEQKNAKKGTFRLPHLLHNGNDIVPCQFFDSGELYYGILDTLGRLLTFSPYLDTDQTEFFQYFEEILGSLRERLGVPFGNALGTPWEALATPWNPLADLPGVWGRLWEPLDTPK